VAPGGASGRPRWGADPIPIVDRIAVRNLFCLCFVELLDRLGGRRMCGDVVMHEPPAPDFHHVGNSGRPRPITTARAADEPFKASALVFIRREDPLYDGVILS
jgi:hypothetical protein